MPVARLITKVAEDADELAADLQSRGFTVEIVTPGEIPSHRVDLEIRVEECASEQALRSAEELSRTEDVHVFIAPGAIIESLRPIKMVPLVPETPDAIVGAEPVILAVPDEAATMQSLSFQDEDVVDEGIRVEAQQPTTLVEFLPHVEVLLSETRAEPLPSVELSIAQEPIAHAFEAEEVYPPSDWPIWQPLASEEEPLEELVGVAIEGEPATMTPMARKAVVENSGPSDRFFWRVATVAGVIAVSALLLGVSAHRFAPIPRGLETSGDQRMPFDRGQKERALPQEPVVAPAAVDAKPAPVPELTRVVAHVPVVERPSPAEHLTKHKGRTKRVQRAATRHEDDYIADDTVVRYGKKPAPLRMQAQKKPAIKHYSDLR